MNESIILANGREFLHTNVLESDGYIFIYIMDNNETIKTVFDALYDSENTATIIHNIPGAEGHTYIGYTELRSVKKEVDGQITASLKKGE